MLQANLLPAPEGWANSEVLERWPSVVDIAEIAASGGVRVSVVQASRRQGHFSRNGIDYHFIDVGKVSGAAERSHRVSRLLAGLNADALHVQGLAFARDAHAISQQVPDLPILCQDHADRPPRWWRRPQWRRWYRAVSATSFTAGAQARPFIDAGIFDDRMPVFPIPESTSRFSPGDQGRARAETGLSGDPCVLWVGHLNPGKDPLTVIDGIARAAARIPSLQLWCAFGSGALQSDMRARIGEHPQLAGRVHLLGKVPHPHVQALMRASDMFVSGSHSESSGYALLEALASGVTPVVTDIPAFRELTANGSVGRLWPVGDAAALAEALVAMVAERPSRSQVRRHFDANLSFEAIGRRWAEAYSRLPDLHARGRR